MGMFEKRVYVKLSQKWYPALANLPNLYVLLVLPPLNTKPRTLLRYGVSIISSWHHPYKKGSD
jgi:hypothetical protein